VNDAIRQREFMLRQQMAVVNSFKIDDEVDPENSPSKLKLGGASQLKRKKNLDFFTKDEVWNNRILERYAQEANIDIQRKIHEQPLPA
jgi:hypothetical protein